MAVERLKLVAERGPWNSLLQNAFQEVSSKHSTHLNIATQSQPTSIEMLHPSPTNHIVSRPQTESESSRSYLLLLRYTAMQYMRGRYDLALLGYLKASELGYERAQANVAYMLSHNEGLPPDHSATGYVQPGKCRLHHSHIHNGILEAKALSPDYVFLFAQDHRRFASQNSDL